MFEAGRKCRLKEIPEVPPPPDCHQAPDSGTHPTSSVKCLDCVVTSCDQCVARHIIDQPGNHTFRRLALIYRRNQWLWVGEGEDVTAGDEGNSDTEDENEEYDLSRSVYVADDEQSEAGRVEVIMAAPGYKAPVGQRMGKARAGYKYHIRLDYPRQKDGKEIMVGPTLSRVAGDRIAVCVNVIRVYDSQGGEEGVRYDVHHQCPAG